MNVSASAIGGGLGAYGSCVVPLFYFGPAAAEAAPTAIPPAISEATFNRSPELIQPRLHRLLKRRMHSLHLRLPGEHLVPAGDIQRVEILPAEREVAHPRPLRLVNN